MEDKEAQETTPLMDHERKAIGLYAVLARDPVDFIEICGEASQSTLSVLWKMLTIYNPNSDNELNELGASLIKDMVDNKDVEDDRIPDNGTG